MLRRVAAGAGILRGAELLQLRFEGVVAAAHLPQGHLGVRWQALAVVNCGEQPQVFQAEAEAIGDVGVVVKPAAEADPVAVARRRADGLRRSGKLARGPRGEPSPSIACTDVYRSRFPTILSCRALVSRSSTTRARRHKRSRTRHRQADGLGEAESIVAGAAP